MAKAEYRSAIRSKKMIVQAIADLLQEKPLDKITVREMTLFSVLGALTFAAKYVMAFLPNIEPVSLFVMLIS